MGVNSTIQEIDLVVTWVDGTDSAWRSERRRYESEHEVNNADFLFRDWRLMRYWFRGVEQNLPWVRRIHFVTWGHLPPWLNTGHPKLHIVRHEDYLPSEFRPTFSSHPIELNMHRIPGLSEQFIYANDDMFFVGPLAPDYYFRQGLPCDYLCLSPITEGCIDGAGHILWNNIACVSRHFSLQDCMKQHEAAWFSPAYSPEVLARNRLGHSFRNFPGFQDDHLPIPYLKRTFAEVWEAEPALLRQTCGHRFRSIGDVSHWLMRYWQLAKGTFVPRMPKGTFVTVSDPGDVLRDTLLDPRLPVICVNEGRRESDFEERADYLRSLFELILPEMSAFELY